jgi:hypothetical protein
VKQSIKLPRKRNTERDLFAELIEGMDALSDARTGKRTLRAHSVGFDPLSCQLPLAIERTLAEEQKQRKRQGNADGQIARNIDPQTPHSKSPTLGENE